MESVNDIKDGWMRAIGIPAFGISIPLLTGLYGPLGPRDARAWVGALAFVGLAAAIWQGNRWLLFRQREHLDWFGRPVWKVISLLFAIICYTAPLTIIWLRAWYGFAGFGVDWKAIEVVTLANVICVVFVTHVYETVFLIKARETDLVRFERLERARAQAELEALRAQLDPHFLFNSLNTLSHLSLADPIKARAFSEGLANVYRYILRSKDRALVPLSEELAFVRTYHALLALRFGDEVRLDLPAAPCERQVPPISVQLLVENAVKHNAFGDGRPLDIRVRLLPEAIEVANQRRPKELARPGAGVGLKNLRERYQLLTARTVEVSEAGGEFAVRLPTLEPA